MNGNVMVYYIAYKMTYGFVLILNNMDFLNLFF